MRKNKGITQEELADRIGVSRQAVSKWESEQSTPDIEKIIILSDFFEVTTDYLMKGIEPKPEETENKPDANLFFIAGTAMNLLGLLAAIVVWMEYQVTYAVGVGVSFQVLGCMIFAIGQTLGENRTRKRARKRFWLVNIWVLALMPLSNFFHVLDGIYGGFSVRIAPYPQLGNSLVSYALCWLIYLLIGVVCDLVILRTDKNAA